MKFNDYIKEALNTESDKKLSATHTRLIHAAIGMQTETGEIADTIKKWAFYGRTLDVVNIFEEIGDLAWYLAIICDTLDFNFEDILKANIEKLRARYPNKFRPEDCDQRDLFNERMILEEAASGMKQRAINHALAMETPGLSFPKQ